MPNASKPLLLVVALFPLIACDVEPSQDRDADGISDDPSAESDAKTPAPQPQLPDATDGPSSADYRNALNVGIDDGGAPLCSGDVAQDTFRYGLCVCGDLGMAGQLVTSSFRSSDPGAPEGEGGGVGVNGRYSSSGDANIGGSLVVAGDATPVGSYEVAGELRVGGNASTAGDVHVGQDAYVAGELLALGLSVDGTLYTREPLGPMSLVDASSTAVADFAIDAPCGCDDVLDVAALVAQAAADNDNAQASLSEDALNGYAGEADLQLPAGRYYLTSIHAAGDIVIRVSGPTALYVGGDVSLAGRLEVVLESDAAALDLFLGGDLSHAGHLELGSATAPSRVRTYVAGGGTIAMAGHATLGGALYAPNAMLVAAGELTVEGALLVGSVTDAGRITVRYDADLSDAGEGCELTDPPSDPSSDPEAPANGDENAPGGDEGGEGEGEGGGPRGEGTPADDAAAGDSCETFMDCPSPQQCLEGQCILFEG